MLYCAAGVEERFGKDVLERLEREGSVPMEWRGGRGRQPFRWTLTKQAGSCCTHLPVGAVARCACEQRSIV